ncbi:MAG: hypothetical protein V1712_00195 [Patescibacteria group bacterium]
MNNELNNLDNVLPEQQPEVKEKFKLARLWRKSNGQPLSTTDKIILIIVAVLFLFVFYITLDANKYRATVRVISGEGKVGINPTNLVLDFGDLARGTSAVRRVEFTNGTFMPVYVMILKTGSIAGLMDIDEDMAAFRLAPRQTTKVEFLTYIPASAELDKTYQGRVYIFKIPTFGL